MSDVFVECGIRPIGNAGNLPVLDRIPMEVIEMPVEIVLVADLMLPEPPLPYRAFPVLGFGLVDPFRTTE